MKAMRLAQFEEANFRSVISDIINYNNEGNQLIIDQLSDGTDRGCSLAVRCRKQQRANYSFLIVYLAIFNVVTGDKFKEDIYNLAKAKTFPNEA
jgi:hypothetical protein